MEENRMMEQEAPAETVENTPQAVQSATESAVSPVQQPASDTTSAVTDGQPGAAAQNAAAPAAPVVPSEPAAPAEGEADPAAPAVQTAAATAGEPQPEAALSHTAALEQELEQLRQEKHHRQLLDEASAQLTERGIDPAFAPFVLGEDSAATRKRVEQFDRQFASALRRHLAARLPDREPRDFSVSRPPVRRRGIRPVG
ncbi:MAG: DUF4355 domain-containing protein [Clostridia bacterium]|nr:DUF4355 domain-containing protein [Clostridia bacterium]